MGGKLGRRKWQKGKEGWRIRKEKRKLKINENECLGGKIVKKNEEIEREKKSVATMSGK